MSYWYNLLCLSYFLHTYYRLALRSIFSMTKKRTDKRATLILATVSFNKSTICLLTYVIWPNLIPRHWHNSSDSRTLNILKGYNIKPQHHFFFLLWSSCHERCFLSTMLYSSFNMLNTHQFSISTIGLSFSIGTKTVSECLSS